MIAVAIIGILAAVAIPQYQDYTARAQVSEAVTLLGGLKTPVIDHYTMNGVYPEIATIHGVTTSGKFVASITKEDNKYIAQFNATGVSKALQGKKIQLAFSDTSSPVCSSVSGEVPTKLLPKACQTTTPTPTPTPDTNTNTNTTKR